MTRHHRNEHLLLWRVIAGQVRATINAHPTYFTDQGARLAEDAITKRVLGELMATLQRGPQKDAGATRPWLTGRD